MVVVVVSMSMCWCDGGGFDNGGGCGDNSGNYDDIDGGCGGDVRGGIIGSGGGGSNSDIDGGDGDSSVGDDDGRRTN